MIKNEFVTVEPASEEQLAVLAGQPEIAGLMGDDTSVYSVISPEGELVGAMGLCRYDEWRMSGIICFTLPEHRRKGHAWHAVHAFTRWFYDTTGEQMLTAVVELENVAAVRTLERAGYQYIRTTTLMRGESKEVCHLFVCTRADADAGAPPRGCCCGCGGK